MMTFFRAEIFCTPPLDVRPCPFPYSFEGCPGDPDKVVFRTQSIACNRVEELDHALRVFFPKAEKIDIYEVTPEDAAKIPDFGLTTSDIGHFTEGAMRVLLPVSELIDIQRAIVSAQLDMQMSSSSNFDSFPALQRVLEIVASRLHFSTGDDAYVGMFAKEMIEKLRGSGRSGWQGDKFTFEILRARLELALAENDYISVANYAMFAFFKDAPIWK